LLEDFAWFLHDGVSQFCLKLHKRYSSYFMLSVKKVSKSPKTLKKHCYSQFWSNIRLHLGASASIR